MTVRRVCPFARKTPGAILHLKVRVCVCVPPIRKERQTDGQFLPEIRFQQHPPEMSGGLNVFLFLTPSLTTSISFLLPPPFHFYHFYLSDRPICFPAFTSAPFSCLLSDSVSVCLLRLFAFRLIPLVLSPLCLRPVTFLLKEQCLEF